MSSHHMKYLWKTLDLGKNEKLFHLSMFDEMENFPRLTEQLVIGFGFIIAWNAWVWECE